MQNGPTAPQGLMTVAQRPRAPVLHRQEVKVQYRSIELNEEVGGSRTSQHCFGQAADFEIMGVSNYDLAEWVAINTQFDQLILEYYKPGIPNSGWVHCSFVGINQNRHQCKTPSDGKNYLPGLIK